MKNAFFLALIALFSGPAFAGSLNMDFRFDMNGTSYNDAAALPNFQKYYIKTGRMDYKGQLNPDLDFRARLAFSKEATPLTKRDNSTPAVELAYVSHKISDSFRLTIGKLSSGVGGLEAATASPDLYLTSENFTRSSLARGGARTLITNGFLYVAGAKATFTVDDQKIHLLEANNMADSADATAAANFNQNRGLRGIGWDGSFLDKSLITNVTYFEAFPQTATGDSGNKHTFSSLGFQYKFSTVTLEMDYQDVSFKDGVSTNKDSVTSVITKLSYTALENWIPRLEYFNSKDQRDISAPATTDKFLGLGAVLEYIPQKDQNFRYHVAYSTLTQKPDAGDDRIRQEIVAGIRIQADFLK